MNKNTEYAIMWFWLRLKTKA